VSTDKVLLGTGMVVDGVVVLGADATVLGVVVGAGVLLGVLEPVPPAMVVGVVLVVLLSVPVPLEQSPTAAFSGGHASACPLLATRANPPMMVPTTVQVMRVFLT